MEEALRLWLVNVPERLRRSWARRVIARGQRRGKPLRVRPGNFICDRHWREIEASWRTDDPIDAMGVTVGLAVACGLAGMSLDPVRHACCQLNAAGWKGVLARSRPSWKKANT